MPNADFVDGGPAVATRKMDMQVVKMYKRVVLTVGRRCMVVWYPDVCKRTLNQL